MENRHFGKKDMLSKSSLIFRNLNEFDWYQEWINLRDIISQFIKPHSKILNIGAGNSVLSEDMYK